jgi:NADP-dependent aldehyde dehydrogenase
MLRSRLATPGRTLRLLDVVPVAQPLPQEEVVTASITDPTAMADACRDVDAVVHLAGLPSERPWDGIVATNITGTHTVLDASRRCGVGRVVLASSNHAVGFTPRPESAPTNPTSSGATLAANTGPRPDTYYGVAKVAMEALGSLYADRFGMDVACLRIGTCDFRPTDLRTLATWLSPDDLGRLVEACLTAPPFGYRVVWGVSANTRGWWSLAEGAELGYQPRDDAERYAHEVADTPARFLDLVGGHVTDLPLGG